MSTHFRPTAAMTSLVLLVATAAFLPRGAVQQTSPCRTVSDTAAAEIYAIKQMLASNDADTSDVALVADLTTCQAAVGSYNAASDSSLRIGSGYVFRAGSKYFLYLPPAPGTPYTTEVLVLFDNTFRILVRMAGVG